MTSALRLPRTELRTPLGLLLVYSAFTEAKSSAAACCFVSLEAAQASNCQRRLVFPQGPRRADDDTDSFALSFVNVPSQLLPFATHSS
jgi:hypothetical protein